MGDLMRNFRSTVSKSWESWSVFQRAVGLGVVVLVFAGLITLFFWGGTSVETAVFNVSLDDEASLQRMALRLDQEGLNYRLVNGKIYVNSKQTARYVRALLVQEDLVPSEVDPWSVFDVERWTTSQFENDIRYRRAITLSLEDHITALKTIDNASVTLVTPKKEVLSSLQELTTASVVLTPKPGVDLLEDKKQVQGIVRLISFAVAGLNTDNITVLDNNGIVLNDFISLKDFDRLALGTKILKQKKIEEAELSRKITQSLSKIVGKERIEIINVAIDLDYIDRKERVKEYLPITLRKDNPATPYDESEILAPAPISQSKEIVTFKGSGFNPEGPAGMEGQTPPGYKELDNLVGNYDKNQAIQNYQYGEMEKEEVASPLEVQKIAVGLAIDGTWEKILDEAGNPKVVNGKTERKYQPVAESTMASIRNVLKNSLGIDEERGDTVTVENIPFDRSAEFEQEDSKYEDAKNRQRLYLIILGMVVGLIFLAGILRIVIKERDRRKRAREEELARQHQAMRESALRAAEEDIANTNTNLVGEVNAVLQESAVTIARDNPKSVAELVRLWITEDW